MYTVTIEGVRLGHRTKERTMTRYPHHDLNSSLLIVAAVAVLGLLFWVALHVPIDLGPLVMTI